MHRNSIRYKDVWAAPGSELHATLEEAHGIARPAKLAKAETIYQRCEKDAAELLKNALEKSK
jgi:hypothetical protein